MTEISCELCGKQFKRNSNYKQHKNRKTPCINEDKLNNIIDKKLEKKIKNLDIQEKNINIQKKIQI